jgi:polysaccharide deacetylase family protein (PEP-CTERM system associated)
MMRNAMTVDVEDYFQVSAFEKHIDRADWDRLPHRVERNTHRILDLFDEHGVKATFFTLGWVAERYPELVRRMVNDGHELASHGYSHVRATQQTPTEFFEDVKKTKAMLEDISGAVIKGYRAASYSINDSNMWALQVLAETGHLYSSSIYPVKHDLYGVPDAPRFSFRPHGENGILEIPVTTVELLGKKLPCGGGGYFRLYPYPVSRWAIRRVNHHDRQPGIFYFHPWEIDADQPQQKNIGLKTRFRHYLNLERMEHRLCHLLQDFSWGRMDSVFLGAEN